MSTSNSLRVGGINTLVLPHQFPLLFSPNRPSIPFVPSPAPFTFPHTSSKFLIHLEISHIKYLLSPQFPPFFSPKQSFHTLLFQSFSIFCSRVMDAFDSPSDFAYKYPRPPSPQLCFFLSPNTAPILSFSLLLVDSLSAFLFTLVCCLYISFPSSLFPILS